MSIIKRLTDLVEIKGMKYLFMFLIYLLVSVFTLRFDPEVKDLEWGIFSNYNESFVEDGDLNLVNQTKPENRWSVTETLNQPTLHDHGIVTLWWPFYAYSKMIKSFGVNLDYGQREGYRSTMVFAAVFFFLVVSILSFKAVASFFSRKLKLIDFILISFGTSLFWYGLIHPANSDLTSALFPFLLFYVHELCLKEGTKLNWFTYGLFLGMGVVVKVSLLFYFIFPVHYVFVKREEILSHLKKYLPTFMLGILLPIGLFFVNEFVKYGRLQYSYSEIVSPYNLFFEMVFGPAGYLIISPIYCLSLFALFYILRKEESRKNHSLILFLLIAPIVKVLVEVFSFQGNADFGGRHLLTDHMVFLFLFPTLYWSGKKNIGLRVLSSLLVIQTLRMGFVFLRDNTGEFRWGIEHDWGWSAVSTEFYKFVYFLGRALEGLHFNELMSLGKYLPILLLGSALLGALLKLNLQNLEVRKKFLITCSLFLVISYTLITGANLVFNCQNVANLKDQGFFKSIMIVNGPEAFFFEDNVGNILMHKKFSQMRGDKAMEKKAQMALETYTKKAISQIVYDPNGVKEKLQYGEYEFPDPFGVD